MIQYDYDNEYFPQPRLYLPDRDAEHILNCATGHAPARTVLQRPTAESAPTPEQLEQIQAKAAEWQDKYTRLYAELENSKKRLARLYANQAEQEKEQLLRDMLPVADNLEHALANAPGDEAEAGLRQGVALTLKAFKDALDRHGVRPIRVQGQRFDPELHEAIGVVPHSMLSPGTVVRVEQKGYVVGDKLLRPARVLVAAG